jgi:DNA primase
MTAVLDIAKGYLKKVKPSGNENVMAICPFHRKPDGSEERDGSFAMNVNSGLWFCHSCKSQGNFYTFLRTLGISHLEINAQFKYAIDEAAEHIPTAANPLRPVPPVDPNVEPLQEGFLGLFNYYPQLMADEGYPSELCQQFGVGFDELHQRVTFPLRDLAGRLVGISGRTVVGAKPRYKVYDKEYLDFGLAERATQKRVLIWNAHEALVALATTPRDQRILVVVEGFKGCMRVAQAGISSVVSLIGSHLAKEQQWFLEKTEASIYMMWDNNEAGRTGCLKAAENLLGHVAKLYFVEYDAPQPSDLTPEEVVAAVAAAKPFTVWFNQQLTPTS